MTQFVERGSYPAKPKILFVGLAESTHTHAWIDLLEGSEIQVRLFALPSGSPPDSWRVVTYVTEVLKRTNSATRKYLYAGLFAGLRYLFQSGLISSMYGKPERLAKSLLFIITSLSVSLPPLFPVQRFAGGMGIDRFGAEIWLAYTIRHWKPDIIHTLGLFDNQGGMFYYKVRKEFHLEGHGLWVHQMRGGSDMTLRRHDPEHIDLIRQVLSECDQIITDNYANIDYAQQLGISKDKFANIVPIPGSGGIETDSRAMESLQPPSERERIIIWPKAYESPWSKGLPVLEAIKLAWDKINPCEIYFFATDSEVKNWHRLLPLEIREHCHIFERRIPRADLLGYLKRARVLLTPSLIDGVPNVLYEAMAYGAFPIVSPLETLTPVFKQKKNVLFARNLYPQEMSEALAQAMSDDELVDNAARNNAVLVRKIADRQTNAINLSEYYLSLVRE